MPIVAHQPAGDEVVERAQGLLDRRGAVGPVQLVEVDVVDAEAGDAGLARGDDVVVRRARRGHGSRSPSWWRRARRRAGRGSRPRGSPRTGRRRTRRRCRSGSRPASSTRSTITRASASSTVVIGGMPVPNVIAPSESFETSRPLAPSRRRSITRFVTPVHHVSPGGDGGGLELAERADHQPERAPGALGDRARAVGDRGAVEREAQAAARLDLTAADVVVERRHLPRVHGLHRIHGARVTGRSWRSGAR